MRNYVAYHVHSDYSLLDSCTKFEDYIDIAVRNGQTSLGSTEHGNIYNFVKKKQACERQGIKYLHGCEVYLTESLSHIRADESSDECKEYRVRDNYHTILIAKNFEGLKEINTLVSISNRKDHFYFRPRITFDEFLSISDNVIKTSACLASPLNRRNLSKTALIYSQHSDDMSIEYQNYIYSKLCEAYDFFEIQPHANSEEQKAFNEYLLWLSKKYNKPLIAAGDFHSSTQYKAECRSILQRSKKIEFTDEDKFDLTYKSYDEFVEAFKEQGTLAESVYMEAIENTNVMADSVEDFKLDTKIKYPKMYKNDEEVFVSRVYDMFHKKLEKGIIPLEQRKQFEENIEEELRVFKKTNMCGFMLSMSEIICHCKENGIAFGFSRGSCGGSCIAYITDIIDVNPVKWHTIFSRFCNEDRIEVGDIDVDVYKDDRDFVYDYIINRFGTEKTAHVLALGTVADKGAIDEIGRALDISYKESHGEDCNSPYSLKVIEKVKKDFDSDREKCIHDNPDIFKYFDGIVGTYVSQSMHPAGIIASPITLRDNYGTLISDDIEIIQLDMDCCHDVGLVKYDILGLKNVGVVKKACQYAGIDYPKSNEINFDDDNVWNDMLKSPIGIFQFEEDYAFSLLRQFNTKSIEDMCLVTAMIRPSGASYRNDLIRKIVHKNPSEIIDRLLSPSYGYLVYQEDTIAFLQQVCGLSGSEADNIRRAIGHKDMDRLQKAMPSILEGYCNKSDKPREQSENEVKEFLRVIQDSASYQFGRNHSVGYSLLGFVCAFLRKYYTIEFVTALLNCAEKEEDYNAGQELANERGINVVSPKFRYSKAEYFFDKNKNCIYKGTSSIKFMNASVSDALYELRNDTFDSFTDLLYKVKETGINARQLEILIKLDYFSEFGNSRELMVIYNNFVNFKNGKTKTISKSKLTEKILYDIVSRNANETAAQFNKLNCRQILLECEQFVKCKNMPDFSYKEKIQDQKEYVGYISIKTDKQEDRPKIIILNKRTMKSKDNNKPWSVVIDGQSIGSGRKNSYTIPITIYNKQQFNVDDIINIKSWYRHKRGYYYITDYEIVI